MLTLLKRLKIKLRVYRLFFYAYDLWRLVQESLIPQSCVLSFEQPFTLEDPGSLLLDELRMRLKG